MPIVYTPSVKRKPPVWQDALHRRGLSPPTIRHFRLGHRATRHGPAIAYPVQPGGPRCRAKYVEGRGQKYAWWPARPDGLTFYDPDGQLANRIARAGGVLVLASGEPDVWALWEGGIHNATCTLQGEGCIPPWLVAELHRLDVRALRVWPDRDQAGQRHAEKLAAALDGTGITLDVRMLPGAMGSKQDINALLLQVGADGLQDALEACPPWPVVAAKRESKKPPRTYAPLGDGDALYGQWCLDVERAAIAAWNIPEPNGKRWSRGHFPSPLREDRHPNAHWNYEKHGFYDFATSEFYNTHQVAHLLNFESWPDYRKRHAPQTRQDATGRASSRFPNGLPLTLNKRLLNAHHKLPVKNQGPAALVLMVWHELADYLQDGTWFDAPTFRRATEAIGRNLTRHITEAGLAQLVAWGFVERLEAGGNTPNDELCKKRNLPTLTEKEVRLYFQHNSSRGRKPRTLYRFRPITESLPGFEAAYRRLEREHAYRDAPDNVTPEWGGLTPEQVSAWEAHREPVYKQFQDARARATERYERALDFLAADGERIEAGRYHAVTLPPGELPNAAAYRAALARWRVEQAGGKRENAWKLQFDCGVHRSTLSRLYERADLVPIQETRVIPCDQVTDYQRERGLVLAEKDGQAEIRVAGSVKLKEVATEDELQAYEAHRERQRHYAALASERGQREPRYTPEKTPASTRPLTIPQTFSDQFLSNQYEYAPLPDALYDTETGEVFEGAALWRAGADWLLGKGASMATFTAYTAPPDTDFEAESRPPAAHEAHEAHEAHHEPREPEPEPVRAFESMITAAAQGHVCGCGKPGTRLLVGIGWCCPACYEREHAAVVARLRGR